MFRLYTKWFIPLLVAVMPLAAQVSMEAAGEDNTANNYTPMTASQDYGWTMHQVTDPTRLFIIALRAGIDHAENAPNGWSEGTAGYAERVASRLGRLAVRENLAYGLRRLDHEDPRYMPAASHGFVSRTRHAVEQTFVARNREGHVMPAYSSLAADFATPFIAQTWQPGTIRGSRELRAGGIAIGMNAFSNICTEFWPDVRRKLRK